jgi:hypothetical protein
LKKKGKRKEETIDLDECLRTKGLRDNLGEARRLLNGKAVIGLFSATLHKFSRIPQARRPRSSTSGQVFTSPHAPCFHRQHGDVPMKSGQVPSPLHVFPQPAKRAKVEEWAGVVVSVGPSINVGP